MINKLIDPRRCVTHKTDEAKVALYLWGIIEGDIFPPVEALYIEATDTYIIRDGNHRVEAHKKACREVWADVFDEEEYPNYHLLGSRVSISLPSVVG